MPPQPPLQGSLSKARGSGGGQQPPLQSSRRVEEAGARKPLRGAATVCVVPNLREELKRGAEGCLATVWQARLLHPLTQSTAWLSLRGQVRECPLQQQEEINCINMTQRAVSTQTPLVTGSRSCSIRARRGRKREQFFSWLVEKSIRKSEHDLPQAHTLRGSMPGAEDGRDAPSPGEPWSKPFTALRSNKREAIK